MRKNVLITGVASGIGEAAAKLFHEKGWVVSGIDKCGYQNSVLNRYMIADLSEINEIDDAINGFCEEVDGLHALVNNAGIHLISSAQDTLVKDWDKVMAINVRAPYYISKLLFPCLSNVGGCIVNVSSVHALATSASVAAYAASKGALVSLTRSQAIDFSDKDVRVNAVLPGAINTHMLDIGLKRNSRHALQNIDKLRSELGSKVVSGRIGEPEEVAQAIYFLSDNEKSSYINGQSLIIDGGALSKLSTE